MELSVRKDGRYFVSELTLAGTTVRTIHNPPSIFQRKRDAVAFNTFVTETVGTRQGHDITTEERDLILAKLKEYPRPFKHA